MISSQGTQVQRWSKGLALSSLLLLLAAHLVFILVAALLCPELFQAERFQGGHCQSVTESDALQPVVHDDHCENGCDSEEVVGTTTGAVRCVSRGDGETVQLADILMSFRFPRQPCFSVWSWRSTASLSLHIKVHEGDLVILGGGAENGGDVSGVNVSQLLGPGQFRQAAQLSASLDYALNEYLEQESSATSSDVTSSAWHSRAIVRKVNRTLLCRHVEMLPPDMMSSDETELNFVCLVHPLFELAPLTNASFISSVHLEARNSEEDEEKNSSNLTASQDSNTTTPSIDLIHSNATVISYLSVITETEAFHEIRFYIKCLFTPLILFALVWFMVRLCVHDLYVSIPDRLLITASLAQLMVNLPTELILAHVPIAHLILIDPIAEALLFSALALFWLVFTLDKLADNEPWERTTRYYWRSIGLLVGLAGLALMAVGYLEVPSFSNPFQNHWQEGSPTWVALGLIFGLAVSVAAYQSYLSVVIFRVICDISIQ